MSPIKEPRFFAAPDPTRPFAESRVGARASYERLFDSPAKVRGEASPNYSQYPWREGVPERIHRLVPEAKLIYLVGDPVRRIITHYVQRVAHEGETRSIDEALVDLESPLNLYACPSRYATQVEQYLKWFSADQICVIDQDDLRRDPEAAVKRVYGWLGVDRSFKPYDLSPKNLTSDHRRMPYLYVAARQGLSGRLLKSVPAAIRQPLARSLRGALGTPVVRPTVDEVLHHRLTAHLAPEVNRLKAFTGQPFPGWSTPADPS